MVAVVRAFCALVVFRAVCFSVHVCVACSICLAVRDRYASALCILWVVCFGGLGIDLCAL